MGEEVYLPLLEILHAAGINVIASESVEADEYAFAMNDDIIRIAFTHDQSGAPVGLEVYKNNEAQIVPVRDIRSVGDVLYLPAATIESLTGIAAQVGRGGADGDRHPARRAGGSAISPKNP